MVAVDLENGSERWRTYTDPEDDAALTWVPVWSSVAYDPERGLVFVGTGNTNQPGGGGPGSGGERAPTDLPLADGILALDHETGEIVWFHPLIEADQQRDFDVGASPNLFSIGEQDVVGVGGKSGDYVVLDRDSGEMVWMAHLAEGSAIGGVMSTAAIGEGTLYVSSNDGGERGGTIFALDAADGTILWSNAVDAPLAGGFSVVDGTLYVGYGSGVPSDLRSANGGLIAYRLP